MKVYAFAVAVCLAAPMPAFAQGITDAQIASIVVTANQVDIDAGMLAGSRSKNAEVKRFGQQMVAAHSGVNKQAVELVTRLHVTPQDNPTSQSLKAGGESNLAHLKTVEGAAFDQAYVDHEVTYHQQVLDAIDKTLIPGAKNADLKALLVKVRPAIAGHLEHAKMIQTSLPAKKYGHEAPGACSQLQVGLPALPADRLELNRHVLNREPGADAAVNAIEQRLEIA